MPSFEPRISTLPFLVSWGNVSARLPANGPAGISFDRDWRGTIVLQYRDEQGRLRGMLCRYGELVSGENRPGETLTIVDPECRRRGIGTALHQEARRLGIHIDYRAQTYSSEWWARALMRRFLE